MSLSMNERAAALVDALVADADALGIEVRTLDSGARLVDCGAQARGGLQAGLGFAAACMGGLGQARPGAGRRSASGRGPASASPSTNPRPRAWPRSTPAGSSSTSDFFAMASGPGRALARAEDLFEELAWREQADRAVLCLETRPGSAGGGRREGGGALRRRGVRGHVPDRADRLGLRLGPDQRPRGRDRAAQAARARRRPGPGPPRLGLLPDRSGGQERPGGDRPDQRRGAVRRHRSSVDRGRPTTRSPSSRGGCPRPPRTRSALRSGSCSRPPTGTSTTSTRCCSAPPRSP